MMEGFTKEELGRAGALLLIAASIQQPICWVWGKEMDGLHDLAVRLALAHPERAELALGEGWRCAPSGIVISSPIINTEDGATVSISIRNPTANPPGFILTVIRESGEEGVGRTWSLPPEFDAALLRGRKIDAAWKRVQGGEA